METFEAGAAKEIEKKGFGVIVGVMGYGQDCKTMFMAKFSEPAVTQVAGCHFYTYAIFTGVRFRIKTFYKQVYVIMFCPFSHKGFVAVAFFVAKGEVAVGDGESVCTKRLQEEVGHAHGVHAAADCKKVLRGGEGGHRNRG